MGYVHLTTTLSVHEHYSKRKLAKTEKTYYLCCQSWQNICKFVANANRPLLLLLLTTVRCYLLLSQLIVQSRYLPGSLPTLPTYLAAWGRLLADFGRIIQDKRQEEDKERRTWNNQVSSLLTLLDVSQLRP